MPTLQDAQNAIDQGNPQQARLIYQAILQESPRSEDAWLGLAEVVTDADDKRVCYDNVLKINKQNQAAKEGLRSLEPQQDPLVAALGSQIISREPEPEEFAEEEPEESDSTAFTSYEPEESRETPMPVLIVVGLALSVMVFAIFGGLIFLMLTRLTGG